MLKVGTESIIYYDKVYFNIIVNINTDTQTDFEVFTDYDKANALFTEYISDMEVFFDEFKEIQESLEIEKVETVSLEATFIRRDTAEKSVVLKHVIIKSVIDTGKTKTKQ